MEHKLLGATATSISSTRLVSKNSFSGAASGVTAGDSTLSSTRKSVFRILLPVALSTCGNRTSLTLIVFFLAFLLGGAESEIIRLRRENLQLRSRLVQSENQMVQLRLWLAELYETGEEVAVSTKEKRLLAAMDGLAKSATELALLTAGVADEFNLLLKDSALPDVRKAQLSLRLGQLRRSTSRVVGLTEAVKKDNNLNSCRILSVVTQEQRAILSAGSDQGVFPGVVFTGKASNHTIRLLVIGVTRGAASATLVEGNINDLHPGLEVTAARKLYSK